MEPRSRILTLAAAAAIGVLAASMQAQSQSIESVVGKWKFNPEKSKTEPAVMKSETRVYEDWGGGVLHAQFEGVDLQDRPTFREYVIRPDGRDYPMVRRGTTTVWTNAWKAVDSRNVDFTVKEDGKVVQTGKLSVSADGKVMTLSFEGKSVVGKQASGTLVFDKQ